MHGNVARYFTTFLLFIALSFSFHAKAEQANEVTALTEIADALIDHMPDGVPFGSFMYRALPQAADGKRIMRLYFAPEPASQAIFERYPKRWYALQNPHALSPTLRAWVLEEYTREISALHFEVSDDPQRAVLYFTESTFVPRPDGQLMRPADYYKKTAANTVFLALRSRGALSFINVNSDGNPWFKQAIEQGRGPIVRATLLNEFFNAVGIKDFQQLDPTALSPATREWLEAHRSHIDDYTITRSGGAIDDEYLKPLDKIILAKIFRD